MRAGVGGGRLCVYYSGGESRGYGTVLVPAEGVHHYLPADLVPRHIVPRFRYDQLMNIGWKIAIPLGMAAVLINAVLGMLRHT